MQQRGQKCSAWDVKTPVVIESEKVSTLEYDKVTLCEVTRTAKSHS